MSIILSFRRETHGPDIDSTPILIGTAARRWRMIVDNGRDLSLSTSSRNTVVFFMLIAHELFGAR